MRSLYFYTFEFVMDDVLPIPEMPSSYLSYCPGAKHLASF
jgi:hypothetical protein